MFSSRQVLTLLVLGLGILAGTLLHAQEHCGTNEYNAEKKSRNIVTEKDPDFEKWINQKLQNRGDVRMQSMKSYRVPVVVHIIHKGEPLGLGSNISDSQILSQLAVLNDDFQRKNADAINTPADFIGVAGAMSITFELAQTEPSGAPSTGIIRTNGGNRSWERKDDTALKSLSYYDAEHCINIWVCDLIDYRGYAQFPLSTIAGLENSPANRLTDGVVISYLAFGSDDYGSFALKQHFNKGRTLTHEMGHFLGLRHIWGEDESCNGTDYVRDTSPQAGSIEGCPAHPYGNCPESNPVPAMIQNYLNYTDDACMNFFTAGQIERMQVVLENSPRRASLLTYLQPVYEHFEKIFTPNGDGVNDYWRWTNNDAYTDCILSIFNRFGRKVYTTVSYQNTWDGRTNEGQILEAGVYYYVIECNNGSNPVKGAVTIIK